MFIGHLSCVSLYVFLACLSHGCNKSPRVMECDNIETRVTEHATARYPDECIRVTDQILDSWFVDPSVAEAFDSSLQRGCIKPGESELNGFSFVFKEDKESGNALLEVSKGKGKMIVVFRKIKMDPVSSKCFIVTFDNSNGNRLIIGTTVEVV